MELFEFPFKAMGGPCQISVYADTHAGALQIAQCAINEVSRLEKKYSRYLDDSITSRINRAAGTSSPVQVDQETATLLDYANVCYQQSDGLFDISSGVLRKAWNFKQQCLPQQSSIDALLPLVGWHQVEWQPPYISLPLKGMELDFGGYVKEYAADCAARACQEQGAQYGYVDLGGDLAIFGPHPDQRPWQIGIRHPRQPSQAIAYIDVAAGGLASSGDYERCMVVDNKRYSHILNPRTGWPVETLASVSVMADLCLLAGTATTITLLKGEQAGIAWLEELGLPYFAVDQRMATYGTHGLRENSG